MMFQDTTRAICEMGRPETATANIRTSGVVWARNGSAYRKEATAERSSSPNRTRGPARDPN